MICYPKTFKPAYGVSEQSKFIWKLNDTVVTTKGMANHIWISNVDVTHPNKVHKHCCLVKWINRVFKFDISILIFHFISPCPKNRCYIQFWTPCVAFYAIKILAELGSGNVNKTYIRPPGFFVNAETFYVRLI